jgi:hypothetical protein
MNADKLYVLKRWDRKVVEHCGGKVWLQLQGCMYAYRTWAAARAFTEQREEEIRQVKEEIACLGGLMIGVIEATPLGNKNPAIIAAFRRIQIREQAVLTELRKDRK